MPSIINTLVSLIDRADESMPECGWMNEDERRAVGAARLVTESGAAAYCWTCEEGRHGVRCDVCGAIMEIVG